MCTPAVSCNAILDEKVDVLALDEKDDLIEWGPMFAAAIRLRALNWGRVTEGS